MRMNEYILWDIYIYTGWIWLVVWNMAVFFHILGRILPTDYYFSEKLKPPTRYVYGYFNRPYDIWLCPWLAYQDLWTFRTRKWWSAINCCGSTLFRQFHNIDPLLIPLNFPQKDKPLTSNTVGAVCGDFSPLWDPPFCGIMRIQAARMRAKLSET